MSAPTRQLTADQLGTATTVSGSLAELNALDLLQVIHDSKRSASLAIRDGARLTQVFFRQGDIVDVEHGELRGERALHAAIGLREGQFEIDFRELDREDCLRVSTRRLLWEARRWLEERSRRIARLPDLASVFGVDCVRLLDKLEELPDELDLVLKLVDGRRPLREVVARCDLDELSTLSALDKLLADGILREASGATAAKPASLELSPSPPSAQVPASLPAARVGLRTTLDYHLPQLGMLAEPQAKPSLRPDRPSTERTLRGIQAPTGAPPPSAARGESQPGASKIADAGPAAHQHPVAPAASLQPRPDRLTEPPRRVRARRKRGSLESGAPSRRARSLGSSADLALGALETTRTPSARSASPARSERAIEPESSPPLAAGGLAIERGWLRVVIALGLVLGIAALMALLSSLPR